MPAASGLLDGTSGWVVAVDLGASSGRVVLGQVGPDLLTVETVHRFPNQPVPTSDGLHWNILELYRNVLEGLRLAHRRQPDLRSIGIDSWAVDYALIRGDRMVSTPFHYRSPRTVEAVAAVHRRVDPSRLYELNGLQYQPFNTLYQLIADQQDGLVDDATSMLLIPDLLAFWLTGHQVAERTNASTTGLLDVTTRRWSDTLIDQLGLPRTLFPTLVDPGQRIGTLQASIQDTIGANHGIPVVAVGSHDTASAVAGTPMAATAAAYISSGTWSLVGVELDQPVLSDASRAANFTNEGGIDGTVRYLHNVAGLWLLNECVRAWGELGLTTDLPHLLAQAASVPPSREVFDANDESLLASGDMPARITALCTRAGQPPPPSPAHMVRLILESLAASYATALTQVGTLTGRSINVIHVVGGGSQNTLMCQLTADACGLPVLAGPVEATAIGNVLVQARAAGLVPGSRESMRSLVRSTFPPVRYEPWPVLSAAGSR